MRPELIATLIGAVLASGLIQFLISLFFSRKDKLKELETKIDETNNKIDKVDEKIDMNQAILARTHILRFSDELKNGIEHSAEYFRQQLDDCDTYDEYCEAHPNFKNSYTMVANKHIKDTFERLTREGKI